MTVLAIFCGVLGAGIQIRALCILARARASKDWKVAPGKFASCKLREERHQSEYGSHSTWHIDVHYKFEVDGKPCSGRRRVWSEHAMKSRLVSSRPPIAVDGG